MVTGSGSIGNKSVEALLKDLRRRFSSEDEEYLAWKIDPGTLSMQSVADKVRDFLFLEKVMQSGRDDVALLVRLCGYSTGRPLAETWDVEISGRQCEPPTLLQAEDNLGPTGMGNLKHWTG